MSSPYPRLPVYATPSLRGQCRLLHSSPWNCKSFNAYIYIQTMTMDIHTQGGFNNHAVRNLYKSMVTATSVTWVMKMGNIVPRVGIELAFWPCVLAILPPGLLDVITLPMPICLYGSLLRGQCRVLHLYPV